MTHVYERRSMSNDISKIICERTLPSAFFPMAKLGNVNVEFTEKMFDAA